MPIDIIMYYFFTFESIITFSEILILNHSHILELKPI